MEKEREWNQKTLINELTQGRELANQLPNHLNPSSHEKHNFLVEKILFSYEKALTMLKWGTFVGVPQPSDSTRSLGGSSARSKSSSSIARREGSNRDCTDQFHKDDFEKRNILPQGTETVRVHSETGIEGHLAGEPGATAGMLDTRLTLGRSARNEVTERDRTDQYYKDDFKKRKMLPQWTETGCVGESCATSDMLDLQLSLGGSSARSEVTERDCTDQYYKDDFKKRKIHSETGIEWISVGKSRATAGISDSTPSLVGSSTRSEVTDQYYTVQNYIGDFKNRHNRSLKGIECHLVGEYRATAGMSDSTPSVVGSSARSEVTDQYCTVQSYKDNFKKRKTLPQWTKQVRVCSDTGLKELLDDGYSWRKYWPKDIPRDNYPRRYYRCTHRNIQGCVAKKQVQRLDEDPSIFEITYRGRHTCIQSSKLASTLASQEEEGPKQNKEPNHQQQQQEEKEQMFPSSSFPSIPIGREKISSLHMIQDDYSFVED